VSAPSPDTPPAVAVIGGGLAGGLLALELASLGLQVQLLDGGPTGAEHQHCASHWSYGAIAPFAGGRWPRLQRLHGDLGWRRHWFRPVGPGAPLAGWLPLPCSRVEAGRFRRQLPLALERAGVRRSQARVERLLPPAGDRQPWRLRLAGASEPLAASQVVLAAGAGCRALWPQLPERLRVSWAGVLLLRPQPGGWPWAGPLAMRLPARFQRLALEAGAPALRQEAWQVDPGLLPWEDSEVGEAGGWLAGQISLVRPGLEAGEPPDAALQERRLRQALAPFLPPVAHWPGEFRQVPVSFCSDGQPLVGPVAGAPAGLRCFAGFSAAFTAVPALAPGLAQAVAREVAQGRG
jgi:glycine/D-amino acid oxidase-like deaminating enzyme